MESVAVRAVSKAIPATGNAPASFHEALSQGWRVIADRSLQSSNEKRREGALTMQKLGVSGLLRVDYIATTKGYRFSIPKFIG